MTELKQFLKDLIAAPGLSGHEGPIRHLIEQAWQPLTDELHTSRLGSLHALKRGTGPEPRPSVLIATHMDAIGLMVTRVEEGFLSVAEIGGLDPRVLPGQMVTVHGREDLPGMIVQPPPWLLPPEAQNGVVALAQLRLDTGLPEARVRALVRVGDLVSFAQPPLEMGNGFIAGHSLDNRASVAALTHCLEELRTRIHAWDVWAAATAQEEETLGGAATSAFALRPSLAIAVDVTFGSAPGSPSHKTFDLDKGPALSWGPNAHPGLYTWLEEAAERLEITTHIETHTRSSGTDAIALQIAAEGIPTMVMSIPLRYMHTPVEMVSLKDITRVGRLLADWISHLQPDALSSLSLDGPP